MPNLRNGSKEGFEHISHFFDRNVTQSVTFCRSAGNTRQRAVTRILFDTIYCFSKQGNITRVVI